jgi:carbonic anhydrase/acetyltransferase-like protein (isoleucine patch superfamily)
MPIYQLDGQAPEFPADGQYWVAETAALIGRVRLRSHASVWFGAVLRGDNEWIDHKVMLHGCTIGDNSLVGMGAIMLNGSKIGSNCLVGAGALITEGKAFPDNSLIVGSPARVVRTLDDKARAMIAGGADIYVRRWQDYAKKLKRIG